MSDLDIDLTSGWTLYSRQSRKSQPAQVILGLMGAIAPHWHVLGGSPLFHHKHFYEAIKELAWWFDHGTPTGFLEELSNRELWDLDALEKAGKSRPTLFLEADLTSSGNLSIDVRRRLSEWKYWPDVATSGGYRRPRNELAFIRGARFVFYDWGGTSNSGRRSAVEQTINREIGYLVWAMFEDCALAVRRNFDLEFQSKIESIYEGRQCWGEPIGLQIVSAEGLARRAAAKEVAEAPKKAAAALLEQAGGRGGAAKIADLWRVLARARSDEQWADLARIGLTRYDKGFDGGDVEKRLEELAGALDLASKYWREHKRPSLEEQLEERIRRFVRKERPRCGA